MCATPCSRLVRKLSLPVNMCNGWDALNRQQAACKEQAILQWPVIVDQELGIPMLLRVLSVATSRLRCLDSCR